MFIADRINDHKETINKLYKKCMPDIEKLCEISWNTIVSGNKILFCGNGGSAADCQHLAAELISRYAVNRSPLPGLALSVDTSAITAIGNDYGYEYVFSKQVEGISKSGDLLIGISTSGNSLNVIQAVRVAKKTGCKTFCLSGNNGGQLVSESENSIIVPSDVTGRIQEMHILIGHIMCEYIENRFINRGKLH